MKKWFLSFFLLSVFLLVWCWNNILLEKESNVEVGTWNEIAQEVNNSQTLEDTIIDYIANKYDCNDWSKLFVNYAELWEKSLGDWIAEWYITTIAEWFYIDERWNLNNSCGFGVPMKIVTSSEDWIHYTVIDSVQARDWSEYDESIREMFSDEAAKIGYTSKESEGASAILGALLNSNLSNKSIAMILQQFTETEDDDSE